MDRERERGVGIAQNREIHVINNVQAMHRDLDVGETRKQLVSKVTSGLSRRKWMQASDVIIQMANDMIGIKQEAKTKKET